MDINAGASKFNTMRQKSIIYTMYVLFKVPTPDSGGRAGIHGGASLASAMPMANLARQHPR